LTIGAVYFYCALRITKNIFLPTDNDYYNYLLDAFFHGRTNLTNPPSLLDLSFFENKLYLYWGPAPAVFVLPFYLLFHLQASDVIYTAIAGTVNVVLFYAVMQAFKKYFHLALSLPTEAFLLISFGLASPNFTLSVDGMVWYTDQIIAGTYLLLFYLLYLQFLNSNKHFQLVLSSVFLCLACLSRYTLLSNGILFVYVFLHSKRSGRPIPVRIILSIVLIILAFISLEAFYNFVRFHDVLETGHRFQGSVVPSTDPIFSVRYVLNNAYYCFVNFLHFSPDNPPLVIDLGGNSIFSIYPMLWLLPILFYKRKYAEQKRMLFLLLAGMVIGLNLLMLMFYMGTGWKQFGYRYIFDLLPLVFLLLMFILPSIPTLIQLGLLAYGIFVNFYGSMEFHALVPSLDETMCCTVLVLSITSFLLAEKLGGNLTEEMPSKARHAPSFVLEERVNSRCDGRNSEKI
jgi:hypothetical protein